MATSRRSVGNSSTQLEDDDAFVYLFDRREGDTPEIKIPTGGLFTYLELKDRVREVGIAISASRSRGARCGFVYKHSRPNCFLKRKLRRVQR